MSRALSVLLIVCKKAMYFGLFSNTAIRQDVTKWDLGGEMPSGKKRKRHKIATHKRKKRLKADRHKKKKR
jgi:hypothetical protein